MKHAGWNFARHLFHRRCPHCYQEGYRQGWQSRRTAEMREPRMPASPDELDRQLRYEQWLRENAA